MTIDNQKHVVSRKFGFSLPPSFSKTEILVQIDFPSLSDSYQISRDIMKITLCSVLVPFATDIVRSEVKPVVRWKIRIIFGRLPTGNLFIRAQSYNRTLLSKLSFQHKFSIDNFPPEIFH